MKELNEIFVESSKRVVNYYNFLKSQSTFEGRTLEEWQEYFTVQLPVDMDVVSIRQTIANIGNKYQECIDMYNMFLYTQQRLDYEHTGAMILARQEIASNSDRQMSEAKIERLAEERNAEVIMSKRLAEMFVTFLKEQKAKLDKTAKAAEHMLYGQINEVKNLNRQTPYSSDPNNMRGQAY